jgi:gamma-glutamyltranspeptidase/glutathione hydrolase
MVATSHPLAVEAALGALRAGGTAVDAAVVAAAVLTVADPPSTGIGGDLFCLAWPPGARTPTALAAAGGGALGLSVEALRAAGHHEMPEEGPWTVTVPGAVAGWMALLERFGTLGLDTALAPAVAIADGGFQVTPAVAFAWAEARPKLARHEGASSPFFPGGDAPAAGERFANPGLARILRRIGEEGPGAIYGGPIGERIAETVERAGGPLRAQDLAEWEGPGWSEPIQLDDGETTIFEHPPPTQGLVVLEALGIYRELEPVGRVEDEHAAIESLKLAFADAFRHLADPAVEPVPVGALLGAAHLRDRAKGIALDPARQSGPGRREGKDTVYVAVVDPEGGACSLIQSLYGHFGSGLVVPGTGIVLQNRGAGFTLEEDHPNRPAPGKRPYHTIIPAMLGRGGGFLGCLGVVGAFQQPQAQLQVLRNVLRRGMDPQGAIEAPRFRIFGLEDGDYRACFEPGFPQETVDGLARLGHRVDRLRWWEAGGAQVILRDADGSLIAGSDPRKDGLAGAVPA